MNIVLNHTMATVVEEWQIPRIGTPSDTRLPDWLLTLWLSNKVRMNVYGGFTQDTEQGEIVSFAGDVVNLMSDQSIQFRRTDATHIAA